MCRNCFCLTHPATVGLVTLPVVLLVLLAAVPHHPTVPALTRAVQSVAEAALPAERAPQSQVHFHRQPRRSATHTTTPTNTSATSTAGLCCHSSVPGLPSPVASRQTHAVSSCLPSRFRVCNARGNYSFVYWQRNASPEQTRHESAFPVLFPRTQAGEKSHFLET